MRKTRVQTLLIILVLALGLGYAYINSDLNINGTAQVRSANWDVHWANIQVMDGSVSGDNIVLEPTIDATGTTATFSVILPNPGDYYEVTIDAVNAGTIDAMIDNIDLKLNGISTYSFPNYLLIYAEYADGAAINFNQILKANTTETLRLVMKYRDDIDLDQMPVTNQTLTLGLTMTYKQADENAQIVGRDLTVYAATVGDNLPILLVTTSIPDSIEVYSTVPEALAALREATNDNSIQFYFKFTIYNLNRHIKDYSIGFIVTPEMAAANPGMTAGTYTLKDYFYFEENKSTMLAAFGSNNCNVNAVSVDCVVSNFFVSTKYETNGSRYMRIGNDNWFCTRANCSPRSYGSGDVT